MCAAMWMCWVSWVPGVCGHPLRFRVQQVHEPHHPTALLMDPCTPYLLQAVNMPHGERAACAASDDRLPQFHTWCWTDRVSVGSGNIFASVESGAHHEHMVSMLSSGYATSPLTATSCPYSLACVDAVVISTGSAVSHTTGPCLHSNECIDSSLIAFGNQSSFG